MRDREPTIRSRELGERLRGALHDAGLNGTQAAHQLGWSASRVSRLLSGKRGGTEVDVSAFLAVCGVKGKERDRLLELCREQNTPGWLQQHGSSLPNYLVTLVAHEKKATEIGDFQGIVLPGLLQTGDYARAVIKRSASIPVSEIENRVASRLARQSLFSRERPPTCTYFIPESVVRLPVGGAAVMSDQLNHLLRMSARPCLTLRVVPLSIGAHPGMGGSFILMEFAEFRPVVYLESATSSLFLEKREEIDTYRHILVAMRESALREEESRELIADVATSLYVDGKEA
jgi:transcriptional regulator with XRE-family HTH domain